MGIRRAWLVECDLRCQQRLTIVLRSGQSVKDIAIDQGWGTVFRVDAAGTHMVWLCPRHRYLAVAATAFRPEPEHEEWCPRKTKAKPCCCSARGSRPTTWDPAVHAACGAGVIETIQVKGEIL
jgi:hypothetical protein